MSNAWLPYLLEEEVYSFDYPLVVVVGRPWEDYSADDQALLKRIVGSIKKDFDSLSIVHLPSENLDALRSWKPKNALIFGCSWATDAPLYEVTSRDGVGMIRADDLPELDDERKKLLWAALRQMFRV